MPTTTRFWETDDKIFGGSSYTDLMTGPVFYPSDNSKRKEGSAGKEREAIDPAKSKGPAVLVASYTWGQEARRLGNMTASQREEHTVRLVSKVHKQLLKPGVVLRDQVKSWSWDNHRWAGGAFAFYIRGSASSRHRARGANLFCRRALFAQPQLDAGRARVGRTGGRYNHRPRVIKNNPC